VTRPVVFLGGPLDGKSIGMLPVPGEPQRAQWPDVDPNSKANYRYCPKRSNPLADYYVAEGYVDPTPHSILDTFTVGGGITQADMDACEDDGC